jgi:hypothetical protein
MERALRMIDASKSRNTFKLSVLLLLATALPVIAAPRDVAPFLEKNCFECHDDTAKGGLDLSAMKFEPGNGQNFAEWVKVYDRVTAGEMPPKKKARPEAVSLAAFEKTLGSDLTAADDARVAREGRATQRRLNRYEYENTLRDLLHAPWLQIKDALPEDGEANRFNKVGDALDVSHVQMARYLSLADYALRQVMATQVDRPATKTIKYYAREQGAFVGHMKFSVFNQAPERATFPTMGDAPQPDVRAGKAPTTVGAKDPKARELEGVGVVASTYEPIEIKFNKFTAPVAGHYKLRFKTHSVWVGPGKKRWWVPDLDNVSKGRRDEPVTIYSETPPRLLRRLGAFDAKPQAQVAELDVYLLAGETIRPDAARLFRSRPPGWQNPLAEKDGCPGVSFNWMEVEGPIYDQWPTAGHKLLFGDLPLKKSQSGSARVEVVSNNPHADAERLLRNFMTKAYRGPFASDEVARFMKIIDGAMATGSPFQDAMIAGYTGVLCSPRFICLEEKPGKLDDFAVASRLGYFLWNSAPDDTLRELAAKGELRHPDVLRKQVDRLLSDPKSQQFVNAFLDYWLDLRKASGTSPDEVLYNDYYLDDLLVESSLLETQLFFTDLLKENLPARNLISSDFSILNERLATHYGIPGVHGVAMRKVKLPADSVRGGVMTQASVLKVTANGTTTSPVLRGAWIMERILGRPIPPPPPTVSAIEPDIRGATTVRQQLEKHRTQQSCAACHSKMDPPGFALESFDVMGGWRDHYRSLSTGPLEKGIGKNGQKFAFHQGPPVDCTGQLPDGRKFKDVRELKAMLAGDERQVARNLVRQLTIFATGAPVRFGDRSKVEAILDRTAANHYPVHDLVRELVQSDLFLNK